MSKRSGETAHRIQGSEALLITPKLRPARPDSSDLDRGASPNRTEKLDIRLTAEAKHPLRTAAEASHKTVSDFVLKSALAKADEVLADRRVIRLGAEDWATFLPALDAPPRPTPRLARLFNEPSILD